MASAIRSRHEAAKMKALTSYAPALEAAARGGRFMVVVDGVAGFNCEKGVVWCSRHLPLATQLGLPRIAYENAEEDLLELDCMSSEAVGVETSPSTAEEHSDLVLAAVRFGFRLQEEYRIHCVACLSPLWGGMSSFWRNCRRLQEHCAVIRTDVFADKAYSWHAVLDCLQAVCCHGMAELPVVAEFEDCTMEGTFHGFWLRF
jgi:hypothetical protein